MNRIPLSFKLARDGRVNVNISIVKCFLSGPKNLQILVVG